MAGDKHQNALTPGGAVWNYIRNSIPSQLGAAGQTAQGMARPFVNMFGNGGAEFWGGPQNPQASQDMSTILPMVFSGGAFNPAEEGALNAGLKVYRGTSAPTQGRSGTFWASTDPDVAATYAQAGMNKAPQITPGDANFQNPLVIDAGGKNWNEIPTNTPGLEHILDGLRTNAYGMTSTDSIAEAARKAQHDGLVIHNLDDYAGLAEEPPLATTVAALKRGTVKSPLTGETLFSGGHPLLAALSAGAEPAQNALAPQPGPQQGQQPGMAGTQSGPTDPHGFEQFLQSLGIDPSKAYGVRPGPQSSLLGPNALAMASPQDTPSNSYPVMAPPSGIQPPPHGYEAPQMQGEAVMPSGFQFPQNVSVWDDVQNQLDADEWRRRLNAR